MGTRMDGGTNKTRWMDYKMTKKQEIPYVNISTDNTFFIHQPKQSNYTCYLFGGNTSFSSITWTPEEGKVPNAWVRFWMKVFFDCNWVKNDD
jgi:hypothetical protein